VERLSGVRQHLGASQSSSQPSGCGQHRARSMGSTEDASLGVRSILQGEGACHASDDASTHQLNDRPLFLFLVSLASGPPPTCGSFFLTDFPLSLCGFDDLCVFRRLSIVRTKMTSIVASAVFMVGLCL